ncbi:hypothetical protein ACIP98_41400 [Streptomyces sp. NPDC088354]|uniref:hypothetical protein n=1 Tax=Streptomyces sp. NPDC088354 TaxID=3365856 RepID=UPI00380EF333
MDAPMSPESLAALPAPPAPSRSLVVGSRRGQQPSAALSLNPRRQNELLDKPPAYKRLLDANAAAKLKRIKTTGRAVRLHPRIREQINSQLARDAASLPSWKLAASAYVDAGLYVLTTVDVSSEDVLTKLIDAAYAFQEQTFGDEGGESSRFTVRADTNEAVTQLKYSLIGLGEEGLLNLVLSVLVWQFLLELRDGPVT